jgi:hypothetical protein
MRASVRDSRGGLCRARSFADNAGMCRLPNVLVVAACLVAAAAGVVFAGQDTARSTTLYRLQMLQAAPGRLTDLIDAVRKNAAVATAGGEQAPVVMRHSQGDHWDLAVLWPMGDWADYYGRDRAARRESATAAAGGSERAADRRWDPLIAWQEDLYVRGPSVETLRVHVKDAGLLHYEMMQALPGQRQALIEERRMENAFNRHRGRGETLIFVRESGAAWDVVTLGVYRNWRHYAESELIPKETNDEAARKAGFPDADGVGPYMRTLIASHRDTLGPHLR